MLEPLVYLLVGLVIGRWWALAVAMAFYLLHALTVYRLPEHMAGLDLDALRLPRRDGRGRFGGGTSGDASGLV